MTGTTTQFQGLIDRARRGDQQALGELLEGHREYLWLLAKRDVQGRLAARLSASDLVQQTHLSALRAFPQFEGDDPSAFAAWLVQIHRRNIKNTVRENVRAQKRSLGREEQHGQQDVADPATGDVFNTTPSQRAMRGEQAVLLAQALGELPEDQAEVIRLRHLEGLSLSEISEQLDRSKGAVAALVSRGLQNLKKRLSATEDEA